MAKFKKSDEVEYKGRHYLVHRVNGEEVEISDWVGHDLTVGVNDPALKLIAHNSCAANAKFKVGDWVETEWGTGRIIRVGGVEKFGGEETYAVILDKRPYGTATYFKEHQIKPYQKFPNASAVRSCNAVVAKAINAQRAARNAAYPKAIDKDLGNFTGMVMPVYNLFSLEYGDVHSTKPEDQYIGIEGTVAEVKAKAQRTFKGKNLTDAMALCAWAAAEMEKYAKSERAHGRRHTNACGTQK